MKKTIFLLALIAGGGYYLHWYTFSTETVGSSEHVHITIDKDKIKQDEQRALENLRGAQGNVEGQLLEDAKQRVSAGFQDAGAPPAVQVVEQQPGYSPRGNYPPQGYEPQGAYVPRGNYAPPGSYGPPGNYAPPGAAPPEQDPYGEPQSSSPPPPRRPVRTAAQDLDRGFQ